MQEEGEKEKEEIIVLEEKDEIKPIDLTAKEGSKWDWADLRERQKNLIKSEKTGVLYKKDKYIIGQRTTNDAEFIEKNDPLDLIDSSVLRKYILAVEKFTQEKEDARSKDEAQNRLLKYVICYVLGVSSVLWALYAGMINLTH